MRIFSRALVLFFPLLGMASSSSFLSQSKVLNGSKIIPIRVNGGKEILPVFPVDRGKSISLITADGLKILNKTTGKRRKLDIHGCGNDQYAAPYRLNDASTVNESFALIGDDRTLKVKWLEAEVLKDSQKPECIYKKDFSLKDLSRVKIRGVEGDVYFVNYKVNDTKESDACMNDVSGFQSIGIVRDGRCQNLLESKLDCEGQGYHRGRFSTPVGMLELSRGTLVEQWLIFKAIGYEGDAFVGIKVGAEKEMENDRVDFYVYSGC